jgi:hypothetical protein
MWAPRANGQAMKGGQFFRKRTLMTPPLSSNSSLRIASRGENRNQKKMNHMKAAENEGDA